jgi:hypothetical protein
MSPQTKVAYRKTVARADGIERLTSYGTRHRQHIGLTREQIRRPSQDVDGLLLGQPPLGKEMFPNEIEVWYWGPVAIVGEKLIVLGFIGGWMGYVLNGAFRVIGFALLE